MLVAQFGTDCAPESSFVVWLGPGVKLGRWLTAFTVNVNVSVATGEPARKTVTVISVEPTWLVAGVMSRVRTVPFPETRILALGRSVWLLEVAVTVMSLTGSPTLNEIASDLF